mgnify:CR=1 FL=1
MYEDIALYYDLVHADLIDDVAYVLGEFSPADGAVLVLGCGTGRVIWPLARAGFMVVGLDNSPAMLARAQAYLAQHAELEEHVTLLQADMRDFSCDREFGVAIALNNTFMHLTMAEMGRVLGRVKRGLGENGRLFLDLINPIAIANTADTPEPELERELVDPETGDAIAQLASNWLDVGAQILHVEWVYERTPADGSAAQRTSAHEQYHYHFPHQLEMVLRESGFQLTQMKGDYDGSSFTEDSPRLLLTAQRV